MIYFDRGTYLDASPTPCLQSRNVGWPKHSTRRLYPSEPTLFYCTISMIGFAQFPCLNSAIPPNDMLAGSCPKAVILHLAHSECKKKVITIRFAFEPGPFNEDRPSVSLPTNHEYCSMLPNTGVCLDASSVEAQHHLVCSLTCGQRTPTARLMPCN